jgi:hypothetical protein
MGNWEKVNYSKDKYKEEILNIINQLEIENMGSLLECAKGLFRYQITNKKLTKSTKKPDKSASPH